MGGYHCYQFMLRQPHSVEPHGEPTHQYSELQGVKVSFGIPENIVILKYDLVYGY